MRRAAQLPYVTVQYSAQPRFPIETGTCSGKYRVIQQPPLKLSRISQCTTTTVDYNYYNYYYSICPDAVGTSTDKSVQSSPALSEVSLSMPNPARLSRQPGSLLVLLGSRQRPSPLGVAVLTGCDARSCRFESYFRDLLIRYHCTLYGTIVCLLARRHRWTQCNAGLSPVQVAPTANATMYKSE